MQEKDCTAFLFLSSVLIKSLHHVGNFPWVVYLLPDNMRLLNVCKAGPLIPFCIVVLCCKSSKYTGALQMACLYLVINIFHLKLSASATEMRGDHLSMKDEGPEKRKAKIKPNQPTNRTNKQKNNKALSCMQNDTIQCTDLLKCTKQFFLHA